MVLLSGNKNTSVGPEITRHHYSVLKSDDENSKRINFNLQSLTDLAATISLTNTTYSVVVQYHDINSLSVQLDTLLRQSYKPTSIYIVAPEMEKSTIIENAIHNNTIIHFTALPSSPNAYWFNINSIQTDYIVVLNHHEVQPGKEYIKLILRLLNTPHFKNTFISTENNCSSQNAHYVNKLEDIWAFRREWLLEMTNQQQHPSLALLNSKLHIPSILIPTLEDYPQLKGNTNSVCTDNQHKEGSIVFYMDDMSSADFNDLVCQFNKQHRVIHVITSATTTMNPCPSRDNVIIRHTVTKTTKNELSHLVNLLLPRVIIYENHSNSPLMHINTATCIGLPKMEIASMSWIADLSLESLERWNTPKVKLIMTTSGSKRLESVKRTVNSIQHANYLGDKVDVYLLMDEKSDVATQKYISDHVAWTAGNKQIRHRISGVHPMQIFVESWYPSDDHEYAVILDDRVELSSSFYIWIKQALLRYRYDTTTNKNVFGISLYSPVVIDTDPSGRQFFHNEYTSPYFMQAPSSAGALYFPEHWREFHDYVTARLTDQAIVKKKTHDRHLFADSLLKASRSDKWVYSWRKYFDEVINMRGYVMLYPPYHTSYSTLHIDLAKKKNQELYGPVLEKLYHIPLSDTVSPQLPDMDLLPLFDFYGKQVEHHELLIERGHELQRSFSACEPKLDHHHDPSDMLCPFSHLIQIPVEQSTQDIPTLSINLYSR